MQMDAKTQMVIGIAVAIVTLAAHGALALPTGIPPEAGVVIASWANFLLAIYVVINPILLSYSSSKPGPLAPPDAPVTVAATRLAELPPGSPAAASAKADVIQAAAQSAIK